jgi:ribosomal protein S18 acetylase RimI-like enzyme
MENLSLKEYTQTHIHALAAFLASYSEKYPDAKVFSPEFYTYHPIQKDGGNAFCVFDSKERMVGFAPMFPAVAVDGPAPELKDIWTILLASPDCHEAETVRELMLGRVRQRLEELKAKYKAPQVRLASDMMVSQKAEIDFLLGKGFEPFEEMFVMDRDLAQEIPSIAIPADVNLHQSKLETEEEQVRYLKVFNACFPENPKDLEGLRFLLNSNNWEKGRAFMAYSPSYKLIGSILVYLIEDGKLGLVDDVMVLAAWRGRDIAKCLIGEGLGYLRTLDLSEARLEVKASNAPAVAVYQAMGYRKINEEVLLGKMF